MAKYCIYNLSLQKNHGKQKFFKANTSDNLRVINATGNNKNGDA
jgi:hypothetical protein